MDIEKVKAEFSDGRFRGPKYTRMLILEVEELQRRVQELEALLSETNRFWENRDE